MRTYTSSLQWRSILRTLLLLGSAPLALLALVSVLIVLEGRRDDLRQAAVARVGAAIVLGARLDQGVPSAAFQVRLDHAVDLYRRGQVRQIILTGGLTSEDGGVAEAAAARSYLLGLGLPPEALLAEETSTTTLQNLQNSLPIVQNNSIQTVVIVSDPSHMLRALKMARDLSFAAYGSPAPGPGRALDAITATITEAAKYLAYLFFAI